MMGFALTMAAMAGLFFLVQAWRKITNSMKKLPPGPLGFPIFGSFHLFLKFPHKTLHQLAKKYGPIMHLRLGQVSVVVVSTPKAAESFLKAHDIAFADRPTSTASKYITYDQKNIASSPYGPYWRSVRKMCATQLLSNHKINSFRSMRKEELNMLVDCIKMASCEGAAVDLTAKVASLTANMSCRTVFRNKFEDIQFGERGFKAVMEELLQLLSIPNFSDFLPFFAPFDFQGLRKKIELVSKVFDDFLEKIIDDHIQFKDDNQTKDFVDVMVECMGLEESEFRISTRDHIKALMLDMLLGSMDTTSTAIDWTLSEIMRHPRVMKKLQMELQVKVGLDRVVEESDLENLEYLDMVIKETFRLHPPSPLLVPHKATQDTIVDGFLIPKDSLILINAWAIGRDVEVWSDVEKFLPERFISSNVDVLGHNFELIPFGSGRRGCPGLHLAMKMIRLVVAQLVHCFNWKLPNDTLSCEIDMTEKMGMVTMRAKHIEAIPSYRLQV